MKKMIAILALVSISSTVFASLSSALSQAESQNKNKEQIKLVKAISCIKFGNGCPTTDEGKDETYKIAIAEVNKVIANGNQQEREQAVELLSLVTAYRLAN